MTQWTRSRLLVTLSVVFVGCSPDGSASVSDGSGNAGGQSEGGATSVSSGPGGGSGTVNTAGRSAATSGSAPGTIGAPSGGVAGFRAPSGGVAGLGAPSGGVAGRGVSGAGGATPASGGVPSSGGVPASGGAASGGAPSVNACTTPGAVRCAAASPGARESCTSGQWQFSDACASSQVCVGTGNCVTESALCQAHPGQMVCDGAGVLYTCSSIGAIVAQKVCSDQAHCQSGLARGECATLCTPNATSCLGDYIQTCNAAGTAFVSTSPCAQTCDPKTSTCEVCLAGATYCEGDSSIACDATGHSFTKTPCARVCVGAGSCVECNPGFPERDCPTSDPCSVPACDPYSNTCKFAAAAENTPCAMPANYGGCADGGCSGFCTTRDSCDPVVVIKANVNGKYVVLDGSNQLIASATSKASASQFALHIDPRDRSYEMAFYSMSAHSYVASDGSNVALATGAGAIADPEAFMNLDPTGNDDPTNNVVGTPLTLLIDGEFVTAEDAGDSPLIANRDTPGPWEQFTLELATP